MAKSDIAARVAKYRRACGTMSWFDRLPQAKQKRALEYLEYFRANPNECATAVADAMNDELGTNVRYDSFRNQIKRMTRNEH